MIRNFHVSTEMTIKLVIFVEAEVFIRHLVGRIQLPDQSTMMALFNEEKERKIKANVPVSRYFYIGKDVPEYISCLSQLGDIKPLPPVLFKIYDRNALRFVESPRKFLTFKVIDDENFTCYEENTSNIA